MNICRGAPINRGVHHRLGTTQSSFLACHCDPDLSGEAISGQAPPSQEQLPEIASLRSQRRWELLNALQATRLPQGKAI
jgi:hypothetical protein